MQESQQKRTQFRKEIRQRHINQLFKSVRTQHQERQKNSTTSITVSAQKKKQLRQKIEQFIYTCTISYQIKQYDAILKSIQGISTLVHTMPDAFSFCLNEYLMSHGTLLIDGTKKDISKLVLERIGNPNVEPASKIEEEPPIQTHLQILDLLMNISSRIKYQKFGEQSAILMTKTFWNVLHSNYHLPIKPCKNSIQVKNNEVESEQRLNILNNLCKSLSNLLDSANHITMKKHLTQLGVSKKISEIINYSANFNITTHLNLLRLLYLFNSNDPTQQTEDISIIGITITSTDSADKARFLTYCIHCLNKKWPELYQPALDTMNQIIQESPYFIDSLKDDYFGVILQLVVIEDRKANVAALNLLCTFAFYSASATDELVEEHNLLDIMFARLNYEKNLPTNEPSTKNSIEKCTNILCDVLLTRDRNIKKMVLNHSIWEMLFGCLEENNKLFSTAIVFQFFFNAIHRKDIYNFLPSFLQTVRYLPLENDHIPQIKEIKETLLSIYYKSMIHYPEELHEETRRLYETNGLLKVIEDFETSQIH